MKMTSYQSRVHTYSNFKIATDDNRGSFGNPQSAVRSKSSKKTRKPKEIIEKKKIYCVTGTAPAPSKDFFELVVYQNEVIFRKWRIRYTKNGKVVPSEDRMDFEKFLDSDVVQNEIERNLGDDILNMAIGYITNEWLPRLPINVLAIITSHLRLSDISQMQMACSTFSKRLQNDAIWTYPLERDFDLGEEALKLKYGKTTSLRNIYRQELKQSRESEIDWDNV